MEQKSKLDSPFKKDVFEGLSHEPKYLYSKYIYDQQGDALFRQIMDMGSYYLTACEREILQHHKDAIAGYFRGSGKGFDLIELGAGDGRKTAILLSHMTLLDFDFVYKPVDISQNALDKLQNRLEKEIPGLELRPEKGEYFEVLERLKQFDKRKKVIVMLGSNIGNLLHPRAIHFLRRLADTMNSDDYLFMGFDQKKDPGIILRAYSDPDGLTERFNKNLLVRINRELGADFDPDKFSHWESYDPETGTARSFLVAREPMEVAIPEIGLEVSFARWETIHTEISQKYDDAVVNWLAEESGLRICHSFSDSKDFYKDYLFEKKR